MTRGRCRSPRRRVGGHADRTGRTFGIVSRQTQKLRLTLAGRRALEHSKHPKLTVEGVFIPAGGTPVTWSKTIVLSG